jgi:paired amphipathic helix protein Sin3a
VLNDEWVSHPTWASEEAGFVAHKKNSFEEALHKSEEERHEYHVHIEALTRTIAILEPLNARIDEMTNEERTVFKLKPNLGGSSKCIYHRVIKKVYGRDSGLEVLQALQDCPSVAVPVVLSRLKQKNEEWRRAQREWSRTWREVDSKNFYKSLDHQGISFKANDKKNITAKHFVADIESTKAEQVKSREDNDIPSFARGSFGHQLEYSFQDTPVLHDSLKMVYSFLDHSQAHYSPQERRGVERFLRTFIPLLCMYPVAEFNAACGPPDGNHDDDMSHESNGHLDSLRSGRRSTNGNQSIGIAASDLRKKLLKTVQEKSAGKDFRQSASVVESRAASPPSDQGSTSLPRPEGDSGRISAPQTTTEDIWIRETVTNLPMENQANESDSERRPFFANTTFYTLLRLLQVSLVV